MFCSDSYVKEVKKKNIDIHNKKINTEVLDEILKDLDEFESKTKNMCFPVGFNSIRNYYNRLYLQISKFSIIQNYICKRDGLEIAYKVIESLGYKEVENPFIIEIKCGDGKIEILNSCPEEKVFIKRGNGLENYIAIFPENSKYFKVKGKKIIEEKMILPEDSRKFTVLYKLYRFNTRDFTDLLFLNLEYPKIFEEIDEKELNNFISTYSRLINIREEEMIQRIQSNLINLISNLEKIKKYRYIIKERCCSSFEDFDIPFSDKNLVLYLYYLFLSKKDEELFSGYRELDRILKIIKKSKKE